MSKLSAEEQLILEDINQARLDPAGEAAGFGIDLNESVPAGRQISRDAKQVLAPSDKLSGDAEGPSQVLSQRPEVFDATADPPGYVHNGIGDGTPASRIAGAGYVDTRTTGFIRGEPRSIVDDRQGDAGDQGAALMAGPVAEHAGGPEFA